MVDLLPPEEQGSYREIMLQASFSGPLPPPALFARYDEVLPGSAERILAMTEREQQHRHGFERTALIGELLYGSAGLVLGAFSLLAIIAGVAWCAHIGATGAAVALAGLGAVGIVTAFIRGRSFAHDGKDAAGKEGGKPSK